MTLRMGDSVVVANIPAGLDAVAGYVGGYWPTYDRLVAAFPGCRHLSIAVTAGQRADCLDVEAGDASPDQVPGWLARWQPGNTRMPVVYTSASNAAAVAAAVGDRSRYLLWSAHYAHPHICGPAPGCGYPAADGTQWTDHGGAWDESALADDFFTRGPTPPGGEADMPLTADDIKAIETMLREQFQPGHELHDRVVQACMQAIKQQPPAR
jgi:hypothetical protein